MEVAREYGRLEEPALLTRRCDCPGNPAVIGLRAVRPEALRPRLSTGLPLVVSGDAAPRPGLVAGGVPAVLTY